MSNDWALVKTQAAAKRRKEVGMKRNPDLSIFPR